MSNRRTSRHGAGGRARAHSRLLSLRSFLIMTAVLVLAGLAVVTATAITRHRGSGQKRAAIIDQLSLTSPDPDFISRTTTELEGAGYAVDYVSGPQVTVEYFRRLPERHYDLLIVRAHSALSTITNADTHQVSHTKDASLFTGEPFDSSKYQDERDEGRLGRSRYVEDGDEVLGVFGIEPSFIQYSMDGRFEHTTVLLMGCNGLGSPSLAAAFIAKGASAVVGYDNFVSSSFTDAVTSRVLQRLFVDKVQIGDAVRETATEFGPDPQYGGRLQLVVS